MLFFSDYIALRDAYLLLSEEENTHQAVQPELRTALNEKYTHFTEQYGLLNSQRKLILKDAAFGLTILSSLERRTETGFTPADILKESLLTKVESNQISSPAEALLISLNEKGKVDLEFIAGNTGISVDEIIQELDGQIYFCAQQNAWETTSRFLSGNVAEKLEIAQERLQNEQGNLHLQNSIKAMKLSSPM